MAEIIVGMKGITTKTKAPSGLTIARSNGSFACAWKISDKDYGVGQTFQFKCSSDSKYTGYTIGKTTVKKTVTISAASFYPTTSKKLTNVTFRVRGKRKAYTETKNNLTTEYKFTVSDYTSKSFAIAVPDPPSIGATPDSEDFEKCSFAWSATVNTTSSKWFSDIEWQTILVKECNETDGGKLPWKSSTLGWSTGTTGASGSISRTEQTALLAAASYTRWVRVRSRGPAGASAWRYAKYVYGRPYQARLDSASASATASGGYTCTVKWTNTVNAAHPISHSVVQYAFANPDTGMTCPDGAGWQNAYTTGGASGANGATFSIDSQVAENQCLFVRVNNEWAHATTHGTPKIAASGALTAPTLGTISINRSTMLASVQATNGAASAVPDSFVVVRYYTDDLPNGIDIGIIPADDQDDTITVQCPRDDADKAIVFAAYAIVGTAAAQTARDSTGTYTTYAVNAKMRSAISSQGGDLPVAPTVSVAMTDTPGTIRVTFNWSWKDALNAELSWADHADAWESTDEPDTYVINNTHKGAWNISGLETGKTWYVRVRLSTGTGEGVNYGAYSDIVSIDLSSAPSIPVMELSSGVITEDGSVTASWGYASGDGTAQAFAEVAEVTTVNDELVYTTIAEVETAMHVTIEAKEVGWQSGEVHALAVRVVSASGKQSDGWSDPVSVSIADPITATISSTSLEELTIVDDTLTRVVYSLTEMPLSITVTGAGNSGTTSVIIERADGYKLDRPDESVFRGFEGETIAYRSYMGESACVFTLDDLLGSLDDGAKYRITATVQDSLGQTAEADMTFEVHWEHQAIIPEAETEVLTDDLAVVITPIAPDDAESTDTCDIYRLSIDKPELIYSGAEFGEEYVDPYPAIGEHGGHRVVFKTANGDYVTAENELAWIDTDEVVESRNGVIDFEGGRVPIAFNIDLTHDWQKDFIETKYLGGSVQGDWNPAVSRTGSVNTVNVVPLNDDEVQTMHRLAAYAGICHVRMPDGSSYAADVQVSESYSYENGHKVVSYTLSITRVDAQELDGMTKAEWDALHPEE